MILFTYKASAGECNKVNTILVVDDDKAIVKMISNFMKIYGFEVISALNGETALKRFDNSIDLILLDIGMNDINGVELCKIFREKTNVPIIFLTASSTQSDKILGFGVGADDYITKPFDPIELIARIQAQVRRYRQYDGLSKEASNIIEFGDIKIYSDSYNVFKNNSKINLTPTEFNLLMYFINNTNKVLTRKQILNHVWKSDIYDENTVTTYIKRLREKIEDVKSSPKYIKSVRAIGYIFDYNIKKYQSEI